MDYSSSSIYNTDGSGDYVFTGQVLLSSIGTFLYFYSCFYSFCFTGSSIFSIFFSYTFTYFIGDKVGSIKFVTLGV